MTRPASTCYLLGGCQIAFAVLACLVSTLGQADERRWTKLRTVPYVLNNKQDALAFAGSAGWYGNGNGRVYRTTDFGEHWQQVWKSAGTYVRALEFIDEKTGFLGNVGPNYFPNISDKKPLYVTHDAGEHWSPISPIAGKQITGVCVIDTTAIDV